MKNEYYELSEEFRLLFNLYEDRNRQRFIFIDDNGDDEEVVSMTPNEIRVKLRLLKKFLAVKRMYLALYFQLDRFSTKSLEELNIKKYIEKKTGDDYIYSIGVRAWEHGFGQDKRKSQGWIMGKKIISGTKSYKPQLIEKQTQFVDFIIGVDEEGKLLTFTCNEDKLANSYGLNEGAPNYVTPIAFRKDVLTKYRSQPDKYTIDDGYLRCGGVWGLRIDNNHPEYISVMLGDLGHLTYNEQQYWRSFNLPIEGKMSHAAWKRGFEVEFTDPSSSDLYFKQKYTGFRTRWKDRYGWDFFVPLSKDDSHHFKALGVPLTNEQKEFDEQILSLTKVFIDALNEKKLEQESGIMKDNVRGIDKLEMFLMSKNKRFIGMIEFVRDIQRVRSSGVAHLKGEKYKKIRQECKFGELELPKIFDNILIKCIWTLNSLEEAFLSTT